MDPYVLRRLEPDPDDADDLVARKGALGLVQNLKIPAFARILSSRIDGHHLEITEQHIDGFSLSDALMVVKDHIHVNIALTVAYHVVSGLRVLHELQEKDGRPARLIHGRLDPGCIMMTAAGDVWVTGFGGRRGEPQEDIAGLMDVLRKLLSSRADAPGGGELLKRLSDLKFKAAAQLEHAIDVYLSRQDSAELLSKRLDFAQDVLSSLGRPVPAPTEALGSGSSFEAQFDAQFQAQLAEGGLPREDSLPSLHHSELEVVEKDDDSTVNEAVPSELIHEETGETAALLNIDELPGERTSDPPFPGIGADQPLIPQTDSEIKGAQPPTASTEQSGKDSLWGSLDGWDAGAESWPDETVEADASEGPWSNASASSSGVIEIDSSLIEVGEIIEDEPTEAILEEGVETDSTISEEERVFLPETGEAQIVDDTFATVQGEELDPFEPEARAALLGRVSPQPPTGTVEVNPELKAKLKTPEVSKVQPDPEDRSVVFGNYRVVASIGRGGMGEIYLARQLLEERTRMLVALKVLGAEESEDEEALDMFMDEAAIMAHIDHPNVLKVIDFGRAQGRYFLASEYLEGRPLVRLMIEAYAQEGGMDYGTIAAIGADAAYGLYAAHTAAKQDGTPLCVVHRDVSPQNIFVTFGGVAKVIDFGVARATERIAKTAVGLVKGKAAYMSPEQAEGRELDGRSDVFALGVCLWEMSAGKRLFKRDTDYDTLLAVQSEDIEPPTVVRGEPNPVLDHIILSALARDPKKRTRSARELAAQLVDFAQESGVSGRAGAMMDLMMRLFGSQAKEEQALIQQLESREATEEESASLRRLTGHAPQEDLEAAPSGAREFTLAGQASSLDELDDFGAELYQEERLDSAVRKKPAKSEENVPSTPPEEASSQVLEAVHRLQVMRSEHTPIPDMSAVSSTINPAPEPEIDEMPTRRMSPSAAIPMTQRVDTAQIHADATHFKPKAEPTVEPLDERALLPVVGGGDSEQPETRTDELPPDAVLAEHLENQLDIGFGKSLGEAKEPGALMEDEAEVPGSHIDLVRPAPPPLNAPNNSQSAEAATVAASEELEVAEDLEPRPPSHASSTNPASERPAAVRITPVGPKTEAPPLDPPSDALARPGRWRPATEMRKADAAQEKIAPNEASKPPEAAQVRVVEGEGRPRWVMIAVLAAAVLLGALFWIIDPMGDGDGPPVQEYTDSPQIAQRSASERSGAVTSSAASSTRAPDGPGLTGAASPKVEALSVQTSSVTLPSMLKAIQTEGIQVSKLEGAMLLSDPWGGSETIDRGAKVLKVVRGEAEGYVVRTSRPRLTAVVWVGRLSASAPWFVRGLSINDCAAKIREIASQLKLAYGDAGSGELQLPYGGGTLHVISLKRPEFADRLEVDPPGISFGKEDVKSPLQHCSSGWWGKRVVLRRIPAGRYSLLWKGAAVSQTATVEITASGVEGGALVRTSTAPR